jgi:hypothetical protein
MQQEPLFDEIIRQNKILERRNDELLKLIEAWQTKAKVPTIRLVNSLDMHEIENLIIRFYQVYKVPISLYDENGKLLFSMGWKSICLKFHRNNQKTLQNCRESIRYVQNRISGMDCFSFQCKNNINAIAIPIIVQEQTIGTLVISQFFYVGEKPDFEIFSKIAYESGFDMEEYKKAVHELPQLTTNQVESIIEHYILFAEMVSYIASRNIRFDDQKNSFSPKAEICHMLKDKLEEQSNIIKTVHQCLMQQHQEIENLKIELLQYQKKPVKEKAEKSPV